MYFDFDEGNYVDICKCVFKKQGVNKHMINIKDSNF